MHPKAIFFDRDGTLMEDGHFLSDPRKVKLLPRAKEVVHAFKRQGYQLILITNQSGVARGYFPLESVHAIHQRLEELLELRFDQIGICPHHPEGSVPEYTRTCQCRKPGSLLFENALKSLNLAPEACFAIGDKPRDLKAALQARIPHVFLLGESRQYPEVASLLEFLEKVGQTQPFHAQPKF